MTKGELIQAMERMDDDTEIYVDVFDDTREDSFVCTRSVYFVADDNNKIHLHIDQ